MTDMKKLLDDLDESIKDDRNWKEQKVTLPPGMTIAEWLELKRRGENPPVNISALQQEKDQ